jgi:hypothetical protein
MNANTVSQMLKALDEGTTQQRSQVLQEVCPCRNDIQDRAVWAKVFQAAHEPGKGRIRAIHAIATLLNQGKTSARWRAVLKDFEAELDAVLADQEACKVLRVQVQHDPKAEGDLTPAGQAKRLRRIVALSSPEEIADWLNQLLGRDRSNGIHSGHSGLVRLWRWHQNRITMEPNRKTRPEALLEKARQWLPEFFQDADVDLDKLSAGGRSMADTSAVTCELPVSEPQDSVMNWLESTNAKRRVRGLKRLAELGAADLYDWCEMFLEDESTDVRVAALRGMIHCRDIDRTVLSPLSESKDVRIRAAALAVLATHDGEPWFELGLKDPSACVRLETASVMDHLDREANPSLFDIALHDPNPSVVRFAQKAMA